MCCKNLEEKLQVHHVDARNGGPKWLFLLHQLPAKPAYARVKVWRRLQSLGAVTVKNAVYALPDNSETREDFAWLAKEIVESGGEALVCEAELVEGLTDEELRATFEGVRNEDYERIATEARARRPPRRRAIRRRGSRSRRPGGAPAPPASRDQGDRFLRRQRKGRRRQERRRPRSAIAGRSRHERAGIRYRRHQAPTRCAARSG